MLTALAVSPGTASADSAWLPDGHRDILASNDILGVRVVNGFDDGTKVKLVAALRDLAPGDRVDFWIDTDATDPGPEYRADGVANSDFLELRAVDRWGAPGTLVPCRGFAVAMDGFGTRQRARFLIPRRCLDHPGAVRVSAHSHRVTDNGGQNDWAPALRTWYPWVAGSPGPAAGRPRLRAIHAVHHPGFDRLVFRFSGGLPRTTKARWTQKPIRDCARAAPVRLAGNAFLSVDLRPVQWTVPAPGKRRAFDLPNMAGLVRTCQFEGVLGYAAGIMKQTTILRTLRLHHPSRYVIDVGTGFARTRAQTYFLDTKRYAAGTEPYTRAVSRWVPLPGTGSGALHRLYAGPTPAELAEGLRLVRSRSWGFRGLSVAPDQVARVQLTHGCSSAGSTFTVADEIVPTLTQFPTVRWVKIYGPDGSTERPAGSSDSIPECLEP